MKVWSFWASDHTCDSCLTEMNQKIMEDGIKEVFKPIMEPKEKEVRKLKVGDIICFGGDFDRPEVIQEIIFDNPNDFRSHQGDRVTINGLHWNISDVTIISLSN